VFITPPFLRGRDPFESLSIISCLVGSSTLCSMVGKSARCAVGYPEEKRWVFKRSGLDTEHFPEPPSQLWSLRGNKLIRVLRSGEGAHERSCQKRGYNKATGWQIIRTTERQKSGDWPCQVRWRIRGDGRSFFWKHSEMIATDPRAPGMPRQVLFAKRKHMLFDDSRVVADTCSTAGSRRFMNGW
jgi:hypothetical protein